MPNASSSRVARTSRTSAKLALEDAQHVRQRIVGHVDDRRGCRTRARRRKHRPPNEARGPSRAASPRRPVPIAQSPRIRADRSHSPPSTTSVTPLTYDARSEHRNSDALAMSLDRRPSVRAGYRGSRVSRDCSFGQPRARPRCLRSDPGAMPLTRMPHTVPTRTPACA